MILELTIVKGTENVVARTRSHQKQYDAKDTTWE